MFLERNFVCVLLILNAKSRYPMSTLLNNPLISRDISLKIIETKCSPGTIKSY